MTRTGVTTQCPLKILKIRTLCETNMQHTQHKDEKKKIEELKAEFEPLTKLMKEVLGIIMDSYGFVDSNGVDGHNLH